MSARPQIASATDRLHPLLFAACRCSPAAEFLCLACRRWLRHRELVVQRQARWRREAAR